MSSDNPYNAPEASVETPAAPPGPARLWRIPLWGMLIFVAVALIHAIGNPLLITQSPDRPDVAIPFALKIVALGLAASGAAFILYIVFLRGTERRPFLQVLGVFLSFQLMTIPVGIAMGRSLNELMIGRGLAWNLGVCLAAYAAWHLIGNHRQRRKHE